MFTITAVVEGQRHTDTARAFLFPGGESQVTVPAALQARADAASEFRIHALLKSADDVMQLLMLTDALRRLNPAAPVHLDMPYVPYARQDRVCNPGEALGAAVFCKLINDQQYATVSVVEPHSDVTPALLQRVRVIDAAAFLKNALANPAFANGVTLMAPDAGARKRVLALAKSWAWPTCATPKKSATRKPAASPKPACPTTSPLNRCWWSTTSATAAAPSWNWPPPCATRPASRSTCTSPTAFSAKASPS
ncbi:ribose-phosphate pyrophosphokinase-like domain-containing protein [Achromobacter xylosoxidans]